MKKTKFAALAALVCASGLSGCATIIDGTTQPVSVNTTPQDGAKCTLTNSQGTWYITSPGSTTVHKTKNDMMVSCAKDGFAGGQVLAKSHFGGATAGNVIAGGVIGIGIDAASGANYYYNSPITVDLGAPTTPVAASDAAPAPAAAPTAAAAKTP
jgi:hypothetical protein